MSDGVKRSSPSSTFHLLAGLTSGFTTSILLQPADLLKTRLQQSPSPTSLVPILREIAAGPQPLRQLWRGTLPSTIRTSCGSALYFAGLERLRRAMAGFDGLRADGGDGGGQAETTQQAREAANNKPARLTAPANLLSGALARASVGYVLMPITVLKVRYESSLYTSAYSALGLLGAGRALYRVEGLRGLFAGAGATAVRDAPYAGLYVAGYEWVKAGLVRMVGDGGAGRDGTMDSGSASSSSSATISRTTNLSPGPLITFTSGALAATLATTLTNPPDAIKTRLQLHPKKYKNMWSAARTMVGEEGWRALFEGLGLRCVRKALSSAIAWTVYEELVRRRRMGVDLGGGG